MAVNPIKIPIVAFDKTKAAFSSVNRAMGFLKKNIFSVKGAIVGLVGAAGFGAFVKSVIETNRSFQSLEATLKTFLGSTEKARGAFDVLEKFASRTPFSVEEVIRSFNKMIALGLNPTVSALDAFGNVASGTGKTLEQFVEAAADAAVGEFERLKEFGIKARSEGDKVTLTFGGVETSIKKDAEAIQGYLENLGRTKFGGATAEQAKTLNGAFSNLGDSFDNFKRQIGEAGVNEAFNKLAIAISEILRDVPELSKAIGEGLAKAVNFVTKGLKDGIPAIKDFADNFETRMVNAAFIVVSSLEETRKALNFLGLLNAVDLSGPLVMLGEHLEHLRIKAIEGGSANKTLTDSLEDLDEKLKLITGTVVQQEPRFKALSEGFKEYTANLPSMDKAISDIATKGMSKLEDSLISVIDGTKSAKDAFKDMARSIVNDLLRMAIQQSITGPLAGALGGFFGTSTPVSTAAIGGSMQRGRTTLVGERGPELFIPSSSGSIVPNNQISGGGGVVVNQTINLSAGVSQTVRAEVMSMMPQIAEVSKAAVADAKQRGGAYSRAI